MTSYTSNPVARSAQVTVQVPRWRSSRKFRAWVQQYTVHALHRSLKVERRTIYRWLHGVCAPREDYARAIVLLSRHSPQKGGALTLEDIYGVP
jgi:hypothetical protein